MSNFWAVAKATLPDHTIWRLLGLTLSIIAITVVYGSLILLEHTAHHQHLMAMVITGLVLILEVIGLGILWILRKIDWPSIGGLS